MKKPLLVFSFLLLFISGFAQELKFNVHGKYTRPVDRKTLSSAKTLGDLISGYPSNWISAYSSVEIIGTTAGKTKSYTGSDELLTLEQLLILSSADICSNVVINIKYTYNNGLSGKVENNQIHVTLTLVPDVEAEYLGGTEELNKYIKENAISKIPEATSKKITGAIVKFTINENGEVGDLQMSRTTGDTRTDALLMEALSKMPKWKPAENADGTKVKQDFELSLNDAKSGGC
ncbi:MAG: energy transducer TonB [Bacteroidia bacterium]|nr:energy transducer TonB [Bacteroidia bacterium]